MPVAKYFIYQHDGNQRAIMLPLHHYLTNEPELHTDFGRKQLRRVIFNTVKKYSAGGIT